MGAVNAEGRKSYQGAGYHPRPSARPAVNRSQGASQRCASGRQDSPFPPLPPRKQDLSRGHERQRVDSTSATLLAGARSYTRTSFPLSSAKPRFAWMPPVGGLGPDGNLETAFSQTADAICEEHAGRAPQAPRQNLPCRCQAISTGLESGCYPRGQKTASY